MSFFGAIVNAFKSVYQFFNKVAGAVAKVATPEHIALAQALVRKAGQFAGWTNDQRREWVVQELAKQTGLPESVVRFLVEAAVQAVKRAL